MEVGTNGTKRKGWRGRETGEGGRKEGSGTGEDRSVLRVGWGVEERGGRGTLLSLSSIHPSTPPTPLVRTWAGATVRGVWGVWALSSSAGGGIST